MGNGWSEDEFYITYLRPPHTQVQIKSLFIENLYKEKRELREVSERCMTL